MNREIQYKILGNLKTIQNILTDLVYYGKLHPLIQSVTKIKNESIDCKAYRIKERPYSWIPINIFYSAQVKSSENKVEYLISGIPFTKAKINYQLNQINTEETEVIFSLELNSKLIGKRILFNKMIDAQNRLMESINKELLRLGT